MDRSCNILFTICFKKNLSLNPRYKWIGVATNIDPDNKLISSLNPRYKWIVVATKMFVDKTSVGVSLNPRYKWIGVATPDFFNSFYYPLL